MIHLIFGLPALYVGVRFVWPLQWPLALKLVLVAGLLVGSQFHYWNRLSSGSIFSPEYSRPLILLFNWTIGVVLLLAAMQVILDVVSLGSRMITGGWSVPHALRYAAGVLAMLVAAFGVWQAARVPPLKDVEVRIRNLPAEFDGYRLLQLTDLHASRMFPASWVRAVVERSLTLGVDLIVVTGDFIDGTVEARRDDIEPLTALRAPDGVWAVTGNHEYIFGAAAWKPRIAELGIRILSNEHVVLRRGEAALVLAGVEDLSAGSRAHDLDAVLEGAPAGAPVLLLDHQPRQAHAAAERGVALQLSGHTHGGMLVGLDRLVARANAGFVSGAYALEGMTLYVNNGTGLWPGFALRLGRPSELTRITLRRAL
ncbi:metallophosphoesterase [Enterovirga aerilata]|uniref:Metallophosphoesterase n=1 Tax=Enterovirga aerilata TaxID=2730920 RepID=A0A849IBX2_9HYPH|nr:metallophosphoesterase [Enterovirga sp. DB1703]NNM73919.1 metallophosphoesterase [Enterovirga sp. DB1703]